MAFNVYAHEPPAVVAIPDTRDRARGNVVVGRSDAAEFVRELKEQAGKDICVMGGASWRIRCSRPD